jgi:hypothetical protein
MISSNNSLLHIFARILDFPVEDVIQQIQAGIHNETQDEWPVDEDREIKISTKSDSGYHPHQLFPSHYAVILKNYKPEAEDDSEWRTVINKNNKPIKITATKLDDLWDEPSKAVGVRFDQTTKYLMIDIDIRSLCHPDINKAEWDRLLAVMRDNGLKHPIIMRSSDSGGYHIYYWFGEEVGTYKLAELLWSICHKNKFLIKDGNLEIFPNPKSWNSLYKGHRLPLQKNSGSVLVDINGDDLVDRLDIENQWGEFCQRVDNSQQDIKQFKSKISWGHQYYVKNSGNRKGTDVDISAPGWLADLIKRIDLGWTDKGQTNELIRTVCVWHWVFVSNGNRNDGDILSKILSMPGYTNHCGHQDSIDKRVKEWMDCVERYYWPYTRQDMRHGRPMLAHDAIEQCGQEPIKAQKIRSTKLQDDVLFRLRQVVQALKDQELPTKIGEIIKLIQSKAKELNGKTFGKSTLGNQRYAPEWRILVDIARKQTQQAIDQSLGGSNVEVKMDSNPVAEIECPEFKPMKVCYLLRASVNNILLSISTRLDSTSDLLPKDMDNQIVMVDSSIEKDEFISFTNTLLSTGASPASISKTNHSSVDAYCRDGYSLLPPSTEEFPDSQPADISGVVSESVQNSSFIPEDCSLGHVEILSQEVISAIHDLNENPAENGDLDNEEWPVIGGYLRRIKARYGGKDIPELIAKVVGLSGSSWQLMCNEGKQWNCPIDMVGDTWVIHCPPSNQGVSSA